MADGDNWRISGGPGRGWFPQPDDRKPLGHPILNNSMNSGDYSGGASQVQPHLPTWANHGWGQNHQTPDPVISAMAAMSLNQPQISANIPQAFPQNIRPSQAPNLPLHFAPNVSPALPSIPMNFVQNVLHQQENNTVKSNLSPFAAPFVPRSQRVQQPPPSLTEINSPTNETFDEEPYIVQQVRNVLNILTVSPGKFDVLVPALAEEINTYVQDEFTLDCVTDVIFEESVSVPNVRYNGARICDVFAKKVKIPSADKTFLQLLLRRCQKEHLMRADLMKTEISMERLRGFVLFLGELFVNMEVTVNGTNQKFCLLGDALFELLETLLSLTNTDNLKCVTQVLKFSGSHLQDYDVQKCRSAPRMDKIFNTIENITMDEDVHRSVREMLLRVMELRSTDWGRVVPSLPPRNELSHNEYSMSRTFPLNEAVLYGPDGKPLTLEEAQFLQASNGAVENEDDEEFDVHPQEGGWSTAEEMDDEMEAAYEKFLREQDI